MTQTGVIKSISGQTAVVRVVRKGACGDGCSMCGLCSAETIDVQAKCLLAVSVGDRVRIQSSDRATLGGLICVFLLPVLMPLVFYLLAAWLFGTVIGMVAAGITLALCVALIRYLNRNKEFLNAAQACVISKVAD